MDLLIFLLILLSVWAAYELVKWRLTERHIHKKERDDIHYYRQKRRERDHHMFGHTTPLD